MVNTLRTKPLRGVLMAWAAFFGLQGGIVPQAALAQKAPLEKITVSFASLAAAYGPHLVALEKGYYAEEGLEIEIIRAGGGVSTPALISGKLDYNTSAASTLSAIMRGAPLKVIYTHLDHPVYELWSNSPDIKTLADLKGKSVGVQSRGDTMEIATRMVLKKHGIDPKSVGFSPLGFGGTRLAAIKSGAVPAAILAPTDVVEVQRFLPKGRKLADIGAEIRMLYTGAATSDRELREKRDRAKRFLRATVKGREYYRAFKEESIQILIKYTKDSREVNETDYNEYQGAITEDGSMSVDAQKEDAEARALVLGIPPDKIRPLAQMYDYSLIKEVYRELKASGWKPRR